MTRGHIFEDGNRRILMMTVKKSIKIDEECMVLCNWGWGVTIIEADEDYECFDNK